jgi:hypothetical protein
MDPGDRSGHAEISRAVGAESGPMTAGGTNTICTGRAPAVVIDPGTEDDGHLAARPVRRRGAGGVGSSCSPTATATTPRGRREAASSARGDPARDGEEHGGLRALATPATPPTTSASSPPTASASAATSSSARARPSSRPTAARSPPTWTRCAAAGRADRADLPRPRPWIDRPEAKLDEYVEHREMRERRCSPRSSAASAPGRRCSPRPGTTFRRAADRRAAWSWTPTSPSSRQKAGCRPTSLPDHWPASQ